MNAYGQETGVPNAIVFMAPDGLYMAMLDDEFTLYGEVRAFETVDSEYNSIKETQLVFVEYDEIEQYSIELARYALMHEDGEDAATVTKAIENNAIQDIVSGLIDDYLTPQPTIH